MAKKSATSKSKSAATKSAARKSKRHTKVVFRQWTINEVGDLLDAVSRVTLKRMEDREEQIDRAVYDRINTIIRDFLVPMKQDIAAIKAKIVKWDTTGIGPGTHPVSARLRK